MALANFFEKAALSASQILSGVSREEFVRRVETAQIAVCFSDETVQAHEGRVALELSVNLLVRLYPTLTLIPEGDSALAYASRIRTQTLAINPALELDPEKPPTVALHIGTAKGVAAPVSLFIGSDNWTALLSTTTPQICGQSSVPFGAAAAAALACANIFRSVFADSLDNQPLDQDIALSLFDYDLELTETPPLVPPDLGSAFLLGAGAVGNAMLWTLARFSGLTGQLTVVDPEEVELSNLQRYALADQDSIGKSKTDVAVDAFRDGSLSIVPQPMTWGAYLATRDNFALDTLVVALDTAGDRFTAQGCLPRRVLNAWTQRDNLGVSRHEHFGVRACLACLYLPDSAEPDLDDVIGDAIKMTSDQEKLQLRNLLYSGSPLTEDFIAIVVERTGVPLPELLQFVGRPLRSLYSGAICGGILLKHGAFSGSVADVPMAFQSALAGVMLAAELCASRQAPAPTSTTLNLLKPISSYLSFESKPRPNCICADSVYRDAWARKWQGIHNKLPRLERSPLV